MDVTSVAALATDEQIMRPVSTPETPSDTIGDQILLEDYRLLLQELQKQDRWFAEIVWLVLAGTAAGMATALQLKAIDGYAVAIVTAFVGVAFLSINAEFLASRIIGYRQCVRRVAATRAAFMAHERLKLAADLREPGAPLLSNSPRSFCRTAHTGRAARGGFRALFLAHLTAVATLYVVLALAMVDRLKEEPNETAVAWVWFMGVVGALHSFAFGAVFHWRISEAASVGQFIVTLARDRGVRVTEDAEFVLQAWLSERKGRDLRTNPAVRVIVRFEDRRFFTPVHFGIDLVSLVAVVLRRRRRGGATTIPMQLTRQLLVTLAPAGPVSTLKRKVFEMVLGLYLCLRKGRTFVLRKWLQTARFGRPEIVGIENAAQKYFAKRLDELDEIDGLLLAERLTVWTGRYYTKRIDRLAEWAIQQRLVPEGTLRDDIVGRFDAMTKRVAGESVADLP